MEKGNINRLIRPLTEDYEEYLRDESRKTGFGESISFPASQEEISQIMKYCFAHDITVTVQGSRTGVGGGAVPLGGHVMSLERMKGIKMAEGGEETREGRRYHEGPYEEERSVVVQSGVTLKEIEAFVRAKTGDRFFFPPDPTETTASAGGMIACNSSGARTYCYGPVRNYVQRIKVVFADGSALDIPRGFYFAKGRDFYLKTDEGSVFAGKLPFYLMPAVKNAAGYFVNSRMDLIDLFIGSEGTLGIIVEAQLRLIPKPKEIWGLVAFFEGEGKAGLGKGVGFSRILRDCPALRRKLLSIEYFDKGSLALLRDRKEEDPASLSAPCIEPSFQEAVFVEIRGESKEEILRSLEQVGSCIQEAGGRQEDTWVAMNDIDFQSFKQLRHATPECVNRLISQKKQQGLNITKLGSDMSVRDDRLEDVVRMYRRDLEKGGFRYVMFGHIGNNHLHVNIISQSEEEYARGKALFGKWAGMVAAWNGSVSAEHGVGKLKKAYLITMYGAQYVGQMRGMKGIFDPKGLLGRDNLFDWKEENDI